MIPSSRDVTKLPKWAQDHITVLERDLAHWKAKASDGPEGADTFVRYYGTDDKPLGTEPTILFVLDGREAGLQVRKEGGVLLVSSIDGAVGVQPQSSNVVRIRTEGYWR
jgi:hypothetical protein